MNNFTEEVRNKLEANWGLLKGYARCPAHNGGDRNLRVTFTPQGKVLMHCKSHDCEYKDIIKALDIEPPRKREDLREEDIVNTHQYPYLTTDNQSVWVIRNDFSNGKKQNPNTPNTCLLYTSPSPRDS